MCELHELYIWPLLLENNEQILPFFLLFCIMHASYSVKLKTSDCLSQCEHKLLLQKVDGPVFWEIMSSL